ncbi:RIP metalloprotease RseP [Methylobacter marinus]|uniref:RIP metalloprotease RseP n=1 Tax=Methylobacter marinus TaxID=34058 RepID=UPI00037C1FB5|nr:RIP metalloprotease RseP [Methylobacter marinus]
MHTLFYFIIAIGILVSFHEFGHFWVARRAGVKVLRFSVGFGKVLWSYQKNPDSTEYVISAIPLGGYVKMVDEREGEVKKEDLPYAFNRQSLLAKSAIVAAGPIFNLVLAIALFWSVLVIGEMGIKPILGPVEQGTLAAEAGFAEGDEIIAVNDKSTPTWAEAMGVLIASALDSEQQIKVKVRNFADQQSTKVLHISEPDSHDPEVLYKRLGFKPWTPDLKPVIGQVLTDGAAAEAGLQSGDLIISADGNEINNWVQWVDYVKEHPGIEIKLIIERDDRRLPIALTPKRVISEQKPEGKIGASVHVPEDLMESMRVEYALGPLEAVPAALEKTYGYSVSTLKMMGKMLIGQASVENLSGPISIAQFAGQSATMGLTHFLKFLALVSVSLGVLNLLPIPVLDGGHLVFFAIEAVKGSPVSEKMQLFFQQIGIALLVFLMALAMVLDIERLFQG